MASCKRQRHEQPAYKNHDRGHRRVQVHQAVADPSHLHPEVSPVTP